MELFFYLPTKVIMGKDCIRKNAHLLPALGKKALIITYPISKENGSLEDVESALRSQGMDWEVCLDAPVNPELSGMQKIGDQAAGIKADMVIGIGGGSALDTAKTIAVLATNKIRPEDLYKNIFPNRPLPIITIPTTAGTGSEVTPFSVLAIKEKNIKKSFGSETLMSPVYAFLDATYTMSQPAQLSADTAVDALSHGIEGFIRSNSTWISDMLGMIIFENFALCREALQQGQYTFEIRERLLYNAMLSGVMINHARTLAVHAMGYSLTMNRKLSHGCACGILLGAFLEYVYPSCTAKIDMMFNALHVQNVGGFNSMIDGILKYEGNYTLQELQQYTEESAEAAMGKPNPRALDRSSVLEIYQRALIH